MKLGVKIILLVFTACCFSCQKKTHSEEKTIENSLVELKDSTFKKLTPSQKDSILSEFYKKAITVKNDTLKKEIFLKISYQYLQLQETNKFLKNNRKARRLCEKLEDSASAAISYWDLGTFYNSRNKMDSAYYFYDKGQKIFESIHDNFNSARLLINKAIIQKNTRDYTGSQLTTIKAIRLLKPLKKYNQLYSCYNNLGIVLNELGNYDEAIRYHKKALDCLSKVNNKKLFLSSLNNMGVVYANQKQYGLAIENYKKAIATDHILKKYPKLYAKLLDNLAYAQFKSGKQKNLPQLFYKALKIRDSLKDMAGISVNEIHLAKYYLHRQDSVKAHNHILNAKKVARQFDNSRDLLTSLLMLSKIDKKHSRNYLSNYIKLNDSLHKKERLTRNKFSRIRLKTEEYISKTDKLQNRIIIISVLAFALFLILTLLFIIKNQQSKNKELKLTQQNEQANREIYDLIVAQQKNFEEGQTKEKNRISRELHDGILAKLFGIRLSLDSLNDDNSPDSKEKRHRYIEEIKTIAEEIRLLSHDLQKNPVADIDFNILLTEFLKRQNQGTTKFKLDHSFDWEKVNDLVKINIYRIIQEAVQNIQKHAFAEEASVTIQELNNFLVIRIKDNGIGFRKDENRKGIGLENIKERAKKINGELSILSSQEGTEIKLMVKLSHK